jgi:hypothetical protein
MRARDVGASRASFWQDGRPVSVRGRDELARSMDDLDTRLRRELPEIGDVFIDVTDHDSRNPPRPTL